MSMQLSCCGRSRYEYTLDVPGELIDLAVRKTPFAEQLYYNRSFCQDRLGTDIGNVAKNEAISAGESRHCDG
eukprot:COSAG06_NODE_3597_length_5138_cov_4.401865_3_plen_72_part_00